MLDVSSELFRTYAFYAGLLLVKVMGMSLLTALNRVIRGVFANPEDVAAFKSHKVNINDPTVERVRRAHLNDLENILPFLIISLLYILTNPVVATTVLLFKVYTVARFAHTLVYAVYPVMQPARALAWFVGIAIQFYMAFRVILHNYY